MARRITREDFNAHLGEHWGPIIFHVVAAELPSIDRLHVLLACEEVGSFKVLSEMDKTRMYLPNGSVIWDAAVYTN